MLSLSTHIRPHPFRKNKIKSHKTRNNPHGQICFQQVATMTSSIENSSQESSKRVRFFERVKVAYIVPVNKRLKDDLFYSSADYERFRVELYDSIQQERIARRQASEARRQRSLELAQQQLCHAKRPTKPMSLPPAATDRPHAAAMAA